MAELRALLFDVDGTLADTERDGHRPAFNAAFNATGLPWEWSVALYGELLEVTGGKERIRHFIQRDRPPLPSVADLEAFVEDLHRLKTRHYLDSLAAGAIPMRPGVRRLLEEARAAGLSLGIATTTTPANVTTLLEAGLGPGTPGWFQVIAAGDVVPRKKPAPDIFSYAMERLGVTPDQCLALEDSTLGVQAARAAGIRALVVTLNDYTRDQDFRDATLVVDGLGEPDAPCQVLKGQPQSPGYVDLAWLRRLHATAVAAQP